MKKISLFLLLVNVFTINVFAQQIWHGVLSSSENSNSVLANVNDTLYKVQDDKWVEICYSNSENLMDIKLSDNNIFILYSSFIKYSQDDGISWDTLGLPSNYPGTLKIFGNYLYLSTGSGLSRKDISSSTSEWEQLTNDADIEDYTVLDDGTIFISQYMFNIIKSTDNGATWSDTKWSTYEFFSTPGELNSLVNKLYVGTYWSGCYFSEDGGETFTVSSGLPAEKGVSNIYLTNNKVYAFVNDQSNADGLYVSEDGGLNFVKINTILNYWDTQFIDGLVSLNGKLYLSDGYRGFFVSNDNGLSWAEFNNGNNNNIPHNVIRIQKDANGNIWSLLGTKGIGPGRPTWGIMRSEDNYASWSFIKGDSLIDYYRVLEDMLVTPSGTAFVSGYSPGSIYKSTDKGETWKRTDIEGCSTINLLVSDNNEDTVFAGTYLDGMLRTLNGGTTWTILNVGTPEGTGVADIFVQKDTIYSIMSGQNGYEGLYKSIDLGESWSILSSFQLNTIAKNDSDLYGTFQDKVYVSHDDGANWEDISNNIPEGSIISSLIFVESSTKSTRKLLVISTDHGIYSSDATNPTWDQISTTVAQVIFWDDSSDKLIIGTETVIEDETISELTRIDNIFENHYKVSYFPNPVKNSIRFLWQASLSTMQLNIFDINGKEVIRGQVYKNTPFPLKNLPQGIYIFKLIENGKVNYTGKIIKE